MLKWFTPRIKWRWIISFCWFWIWNSLSGLQKPSSWLWSRVLYSAGLAKNIERSNSCINLFLISSDSNSNENINDYEKTVSQSCTKGGVKIPNRTHFQPIKIARSKMSLRDDRSAHVAQSPITLTLVPTIVGSPDNCRTTLGSPDNTSRRCLFCIYYARVWHSGLVIQPMRV